MPNYHMDNYLMKEKTLKRIYELQQISKEFFEWRNIGQRLEEHRNDMKIHRSELQDFYIKSRTNIVVPKFEEANFNMDFLIRQEINLLMNKIEFLDNAEKMSSSSSEEETEKASEEETEKALEEEFSNSSSSSFELSSEEEKKPTRTSKRIRKNCFKKKRYSKRLHREEVELFELK